MIVHDVKIAFTRYITDPDVKVDICGSVFAKEFNRQGIWVNIYSATPLFVKPRSIAYVKRMIGTNVYVGGAFNPSQAKEVFDNHILAAL
jgi:hypothetical protein